MVVFTGKMPVPLSENLFDLDLTADDTEVVPPRISTPNNQDMQEAGDLTWEIGLTSLTGLTSLIRVEEALDEDGEILKVRSKKMQNKENK